MGNDKGAVRAKQLQCGAAMLTLILATIIAWLSLSPPSDIPDAPGGDKLGHFLAYGALTCSALVAAGRQRWVWALPLCFMYGVLMELAQGLMPYGRDPNLLDIAANTAGAVLAVMVTATLRHRR